MRPGPRLVVMVALAFISGAQSSTTNSQHHHQQSSISSSSSRGKLLSKRESSYDTASSLLSNINPWLSACDLAQPNLNSAPDLQGQCLSGTLPVAWINEGPGPPQCPPSCQKYHVNDRYNQNNIIKNNDNNNNNRNNNNNNNFSNNNNKNNNDLKMENRLNEKNRQCLDFLGDNDEYSPSQICKKSSSDIETKLKSIRLRHCCERDVLSALHNTAYVDVLNGGADCNRRLNEILEADKLAARVTCEFTEILVRYDCGQTYSLVHHCGDCKEAYRRWVCSTLIPYFSTKSEIRTTSTMASTDTVEGGGDSGVGGKSANSNLVNNIDNKAQKMFKQAHNLEGSNEIKRSRRKARLEQKRIRIRPCRGVCHSVEQKCPYMLPNDRSPAYPSQYAGEPTFLCLDPHIGETGDQLYKSNSGPRDCCYDYCGEPHESICSSTCDPIFNSNSTATTATTRTTNTSTTTKTTNKNITAHSPYEADDPLLEDELTSHMLVRMDDGTYVLNDHSHIPEQTTCPPPSPNSTLSLPQCSISQAQVSPSSSSSSSSSSTSSSSSSSSSIALSSTSLLSSISLLTNLTNYLNLNHNILINWIAALLNGLSDCYWTVLLWNLMKFTAITNVMLQLVTGL